MINTSMIDKNKNLQTYYANIQLIIENRINTLHTTYIFQFDISKHSNKWIKVIKL